MNTLVLALENLVVETFSTTDTIDVKAVVYDGDTTDPCKALIATLKYGATCYYSPHPCA